MNLVVFEDERVAGLYPTTLGRPAFLLGCGSYRLWDLVERLGGATAAVVRPHLRAVLAADFPTLSSQNLDAGKSTLWINARAVPSIAALAGLQSLVKAGRPAVIRYGECVAAALVGPGQPPPDKVFDGCQATGWLDALELPTLEIDLPLFEYAHDLIRYHQQILGTNLEDRLDRGEYREIADGVFAADGATLGEYCVVDHCEGPIVLDANACIGPYCFLSGPAHVGRDARVIEHAAIKDGVALGHTTKIGGEIEATVVEPYTNKQHHGFLGHSYLGCWVNLGAGTANSDLKNTYGQVSMEYDGNKVPTGMQFIGCVIGDYTKTAVNTSIFTGKTIGACTMVYGFVTTNVPSFVNYARLFGQVTEASVEVMAATQARMFRRRGVDQRPCDVQLLRDMYELTRHERQLAVEPLSL